ncbi:MAG TPA: DUF4331 domain-containing protein [Streptosporangiaceae bacterium]|nr:DUF4331 domain-containing protein [Streptosporangiaceae bacterium]
MSSHREAPEISMDPVADSTDLYAFVSPDNPDTVTLIANYIPLQGAAGGPNFYEFGEDVKYNIHIDTKGHGVANITYEFRFTTTVANPNTFLYNTGPIGSLNSPNWNRKQHYQIIRWDLVGSKVVRHDIAKNLACPPCNIGPLSTPNYATKLAKPAVHTLSDGIKVFAGQRAEGFYVDLGSIFDLGNLRPFQQLNVFGKALGLSSAAGVNATKLLNVHSIAMQIPKKLITAKGRPTIGVWTSASRRRVRISEGPGKKPIFSGPYDGVSRLGMPLINEVIIPMGLKDFWNGQRPVDDKQFTKYVAHPELAGLLPVLYPGVFPHLDALNKSKKPRIDLEAVLLTGVPAGIIPHFSNFTGSVQADMLRLNTSIKPSSSPNILGLLGGDLAGFPNGRRVFDDVVTVELRAIAGATYPLIDSSFTPDAAAGAVTDGLTPSSLGMPFLDHFPYLGVPFDGYDDPAS